MYIRYRMTQIHTYQNLKTKELLVTEIQYKIKITSQKYIFIIMILFLFPSIHLPTTFPRQGFLEPIPGKKG